MCCLDFLEGSEESADRPSGSQACLVFSPRAAGWVAGWLAAEPGLRLATAHGVGFLQASPIALGCCHTLPVGGSKVESQQGQTAERQDLYTLESYLGNLGKSVLDPMPSTQFHLSPSRLCPSLFWPSTYTRSMTDLPCADA